VSETPPPDVPIRPEPVEAGQVAPPFRLPAVTDGGRQLEVSVPDSLEDGPMLLVFYQDDGMPICTSELKVFAQEHPLLSEAGVQVFGINTNGLGSHAKFHERDHFPFPLISDFYAQAVKSYGLWDAQEQKSRRAIVVVGTDGRLVHVQPHFNPGNVNAVVEVFQALGLA
jgi:peroxiredoxin Q/BCP